MSQFINRSGKTLIAVTALMLALISPFASALEVGEKAPDFSLQASDGSTYTLAQFIGVKPMVIAFFPKAFTGG